jgi:hypothetical protein
LGIVQKGTAAVNRCQCSRGWWWNWDIYTHAVG